MGDSCALGCACGTGRGEGEEREVVVATDAIAQKVVVVLVYHIRRAEGQLVYLRLSTTYLLLLLRSLHITVLSLGLPSLHLSFAL